MSAAAQPTPCVVTYGPPLQLQSLSAQRDLKHFRDRTPPPLFVHKKWRTAETDVTLKGNFLYSEVPWQKEWENNDETALHPDLRGWRWIVQYTSSIVGVGYKRGGICITHVFIKRARRVYTFDMEIRHWRSLTTRQLEKDEALPWCALLWLSWLPLFQMR